MTQLNKIIKAALLEQPGTTVMKQGKIDSTGIVSPFNAKKIADLIYNAKGYVTDDEELAKNAIVKNIKNISQYNQVNTELQKLSGNRGLGEYLGSFMNLTDRLEIAGELMNVLPKTQWDWTIKKIVPWKDFKWINFGTKSNGLPMIAKWPGDSPATPLATNTAIKFITTIYNEDWKTRDAQVLGAINHNALLVAQIALAFVPVVGWAMSAGIGLGNAKLYYDEGDPKTAGIEAIFSLIPGLGIAGKLGLTKIAPKLMANLGKKVALKQTKNLTKEEIRILDLLGKNQKALKTELDNYFKTGIVKNAKQIGTAKLKAAAGKLATGATKATGELATYAAIAGLYNTVYDFAGIPDSELLALNDKLDADFEQWLETRYQGTIADGVIAHSNTSIINEAPVDWLDIVQGAGPIGAAIGTAVAVGAAATAALVIKRLAKFSGVGRLSAWNKMRRDKNTFKALGIHVDDIRALYKSGEALRTTTTAWEAIETAVAAGKMTPTDAMKNIDKLKRGTANKVFQKLTKSYKKSTTKRGDDLVTLEKFIKDLPEPKRSDFGAGVGKQTAYESALEIWKQKNTLEQKLKAVYSDPDYLEFLKKHLANNRTTSALNTVNRERRVKYAAFWTLIGGSAGMATWIAVKKLQDAMHRQKLAKLPKTLVTFSKKPGEEIQRAKYDATRNVMITQVPYTISATDKLYKVETKRNTAQWTLLQFPDGNYYWVPTTELAGDAPAAPTKPTVVAKPTPAAEPPPAETPSAPEPVSDPNEFELPD
jgi:hypothetical protein